MVRSRQLSGSSLIGLASLLLAASVLLLPAVALAQSDTDIADLADEYSRGDTHTVMMSTRVVHFPGFILDSWFARHANHWDGQANMGHGLEYTFRRTGEYDLQVGLFWTDLSMQDAYWLETDKERDLTAADWTKQTLSTVAAEISFFGYHDFVPEFSVFYGGGLWFGALLGGIEKANVLAGCAEAAENGTGSLDACGHESIYTKEDGVPPVAGFISLSTGLRAEIDEHFIIKVETGFKGYFFGGLSIGAQFW